MAKNSVRKSGRVLAVNLLVSDYLESMLESALIAQKAYKEKENVGLKEQADKLVEAVKFVLPIVKVGVMSVEKQYNEALAEELEAAKKLRDAVFAEEKKNEEV